MFTIVRFNPQKNKLNISQDTNNPKTVSDWQEKLTAKVVINGSYFDEEYNLTSRVVIDKESYGPLLSGKTGIVRSVDGLNWTINSKSEIEDNVPLYSLQSYPLLVDDGNQNFTTGSDDIAARSIIANDKQGMMYLIITEYGVLTLNQTSEILANSLSVDIKQALNLDGGTSTGLAVNSDELNYSNSSAIVPVVLFIE